MVKVSKKEAEQNRVDIVQAASVAIRSNGVQAAPVADIATAAKLTHGALYRHFPDKNALVATVIGADFDRITALLGSLKASGQGSDAYIRTYLSPDHRDHFDWGCPIAPLAGEVQRLNASVQSAFVSGFKRNVQSLQDLMSKPDDNEARQKAVFALCALSGSLALARATKETDADLSDNILAIVRDRLIHMTC